MQRKFGGLFLVFKLISEKSLGENLILRYEIAVLLFQNLVKLYSIK